MNEKLGYDELLVWWDVRGLRDDVRRMIQAAEAEHSSF